MDLESLLLGYVEADLKAKAIRKNASIDHKRHTVDNSSRRAFDSRMKCDAATSRIAAQNMRDAQCISEAAQTYSTAMKSQLLEIQKILIDASVNESPDVSDYAAWNERIDFCIAEIQRLGKNADFNGIKLMDGSAGKNGDGIIVLQAGNTTKELKLTNVFEGSLFGTDCSNLTDNLRISDTNNAAKALAAAEKYIASMQQLESRYSYEYKSLGNLALMFENQADIFESAISESDKASSNQGTSAAASASSYLDYLLSSAASASIVSGSA